MVRSSRLGRGGARQIGSHSGSGTDLAFRHLASGMEEARARKCTTPAARKSAGNRYVSAAHCVNNDLPQPLPRIGRNGYSISVSFPTRINRSPYLYMCVYIYIYIYREREIDRYTYIRVCIYIYIHIYIHIHTCIHIYIYIHTHVHIYIYIYIVIYIYITHMYTCVYIYIYIYIYAYVYTLSGTCSDQSANVVCDSLSGLLS